MRLEPYPYIVIVGYKAWLMRERESIWFSSI
jgi:hypothetical protein